MFESLPILYEELRRRNMGNAILLQQEALHFRAIYTVCLKLTILSSMKLIF